MIRGVLLDEHYPHWWPGTLTRLSNWLTVRWIGGPDAPPRGTKDPDILIWLESNQFVLLTNNRRSMPGHLAQHIVAQRHVEGIFIVHPDMDIRVLATALELIIGASLQAEFQDQIRDLPQT